MTKKTAVSVAVSGPATRPGKVIRSIYFEAAILANLDAAAALAGSNASKLANEIIGRGAAWRLSRAGREHAKRKRKRDRKRTRTK